ncbi:IclR family transcriptional regulator [Rheinheimera sp. EpRS3]|uniref:IclR family transcriptional regulator n=1 Tax=Rheinheimera sp. EpRS3 TaxID=1712383 RepID=UPI0007473E7C|nr:IclR family transcriptional regulator [Rheinheimera sp. EpRS3]KUM54447.1 transcriptional regulator [Rheinheimera sp. EpRS3]PKM21121.1 MAG: IclR family transcriptional regulator [Gammaproteobacteria bacterium HGW-Gammaproteobacteria-15]
MVSYVIPNLANACRILSLVTESDQGLSLTELEQRLAVPRTTAFRILQTLCQEQVLEKHGKRYLVGAQLFKMGLSLLSSQRLQQQALPMLQQLALTTGLSCHLALPHAKGALLVEVCDSPNPQRLAARPGTIADFNCSAAGKVFLAFHHFDRLAALAEAGLFKRRTSHSLVQPNELTTELQRILARGYASDDMEYHDDVRCLAVPIRDSQGAVVAAVGITGPLVLFAKKAQTDLIASVKQTAIDIALCTYRPQLVANSARGQ